MPTKPKTATSADVRTAHAVRTSADATSPTTENTENPDTSTTRTTDAATALARAVGALVDLAAQQTTARATIARLGAERDVLTNAFAARAAEDATLQADAQDAAEQVRQAKATALLFAGTPRERGVQDRIVALEVTAAGLAADVAAAADQHSEEETAYHERVVAFTGAIAEQEALLVDLAAAEASMQAAATAAHTERGREIARGIVRDANAATAAREQAEQAARVAAEDLQRLREEAVTALADWPGLARQVQARLGRAPSAAEEALTAMERLLEVLTDGGRPLLQGAIRQSYDLYLGDILTLSARDVEVLIAAPYSEDGRMITRRFDADVKRLREAWAAQHRSRNGSVAGGESPGPHSNQGYLPSTLVR
jgi:hypothetical protein